ncbi:AraC family transcriptional regulator [Prolixibacteraceae bacterium Z1-6]|uniref:AraC family transcriptional regulator n=1 Tax=Draconibacterium aestuarii TaxID=2998507 RepID=A0A9X3J530_9BACT|nr:AraC family transcriptional regulator [Prolixibacteraceae bacterium Z1-6]
MKKHTITKKPELVKKDRFFGDRSVVLSKKQLKSIKINPIINDLYISDIGFYPNAKNHFRIRRKGIEEHILMYCVDGSGFIQISDTVFQLLPNSFFIIPADSAHKYWSSENLPWSIYWLHFGGERSYYFKSFFDRIINIEQSNRSRIDDRLQLFNEILTALESGFSIENINYANMCLNSLLASFFYIETFRLVKGFHSPNKVDQSIIYMQKNINKSLTIKDLANNVQLSESHFSKIFRNKTGSSPLDYFINLKMQEAIRLLINQSLKIKEVAFKLGYSDPYYFTRIFSKHIGSSPGTFVKTSNPQS